MATVWYMQLSSRTWNYIEVHDNYCVDCLEWFLKVDNPTRIEPLDGISDAEHREIEELREKYGKQQIWQR